VREDVSDNSVVLRYDGSEYTYPVIDSTVGDKGFDIGKLRAQTGLVTLDSGYGNTAAYKSAITYLDGEAGILRYRGYPIEQLAERSTFLEVAYLLINGELPTVDELSAFKDEITRHTLLHEDVKNFYRGFPRDAHPMAMLSSVVSALSTFYQDSHNPFDERQRNLSTVRLLAKLPTIAAYAYKKSVGHPFVYPRNDLGYVENFLRMTFSVPAQEFELDPIVVSALDKLLILHADHEQNCSTSTVRLVGSSQANMFASISAGINALWGPLHGGANQSVLEMLEGIRDSGGDVDSFIRKVKNKEDGVRLMGFGHRVYKNFDPRAKIIKAAAHDVLSALGKSDELLDIALKLEEHALSDDYFVSRSLYPNVDFYTGLIYRDVHGPVRPRPPSGLDRPVARDDQGAGLPHRPPAPDLHGRRRARLRPRRGALTRTSPAHAGPRPVLSGAGSCRTPPAQTKSRRKRRRRPGAPVPPRAGDQGAFPCPGADSPHGIRPGAQRTQRLNRCRAEGRAQAPVPLYRGAVCRDNARWEGRSKLPGVRAPATQSLRKSPKTTSDVSRRPPRRVLTSPT
jgi:citrate synthase